MQRCLVYSRITILLIFALAISASAQQTERSKATDRSLRIGLQLTGLTNFNHWQTSEYIDARFRVRPYLSKSYGIILQERLTDRWSVEVGVSLIQLGLATVVSTDYRPGRKYESISTGRSAYDMFVFPFKVIYRLPQSRRSSRIFLTLGGSFFYNGVDKDDLFAQSRSTTLDSVTGDTLIITDRFRAMARFNPTVVGGIGWERRLSARSAINLRLTGSVGLTPIVKNFLTFSAANRPRFGKPYSSTNELVNRGSYFGLELCYLFSFR